MKIPTFLDDDEHFIDDDDEKFSSLMPSGFSKSLSIPLPKVEKQLKYEEKLTEKLIKTLKSDKFMLSQRLEKFKNLETLNFESP